MNPLCSTYSNQGRCDSCYNGYILQNYVCNLHPIDLSKDGLCAAFNGTTCIQCATRSYFANGICTKANDNCNTFNNVTGACLSCYNGFNLNNGDCVTATLQQPVANNYTNIYCKGVDSVGRCTKCFFGFTLINGDCVQ